MKLTSVLTAVALIMSLAGGLRSPIRQAKKTGRVKQRRRRP